MKQRMREKNKIGVFMTESIGADVEHEPRYTFTFVPNMKNAGNVCSLNDMKVEWLEDCFCMLSMFEDEIRSRILELSETK